jgi:hypothetical protein
MITTANIEAQIRQIQLMLLPLLPPVQSLFKCASSIHTQNNFCIYIKAGNLRIHPRTIEPIYHAGYMLNSLQTPAGEPVGAIRESYPFFVGPTKAYIYKGARFIEMSSANSTILRSSDQPTLRLTIDPDTINQHIEEFLHKVLKIGIIRYGSLFIEDLTYRSYLCLHACPTIQLSYLPNRDKDTIAEIVSRYPESIFRKPKFLSLLYQSSLVKHERYEYFKKFFADQ